MGLFQDFKRVVESTDNIQKMIRGEKDRLVTFKANASNSGIIYILADNSELNGYPLNAGEGLGDVVLAENQDIYFWGDTKNDKLHGLVYDNPYLKKRGKD